MPINILLRFHPYFSVLIQWIFSPRGEVLLSERKNCESFFGPSLGFLKPPKKEPGITFLTVLASRYLQGMRTERCGGSSRSVWRVRLLRGRSKPRARRQPSVEPSGRTWADIRPHTDQSQSSSASEQGQICGQWLERRQKIIVTLAKLALRLIQNSVWWTAACESTAFDNEKCSFVATTIRIRTLPPKSAVARSRNLPTSWTHFTMLWMFIMILCLSLFPFPLSWKLVTKLDRPMK